MKDDTEGDGKAEIVMDYVMSYSLRHAEDEYKKENNYYTYNNLEDVYELSNFS